MTELGEIRVGNRHRGDEGIYIGRSTPFGNPFSILLGEFSREDAIKTYARFVEDERQHPGAPITRAIKQLAVRVANGENLVLVCSCAPKACHGDALRDEILKLAQSMQTDVA